jgi:predicted Zn-dependent peptidase
LVPAVCEEFVGVADTVHEAELVRARNQIKAGTLMALESSGARCEQAARHLIVHGRSIPYAEIVSRIEAVDQDAVRRVARRLLKGELTLAALGPIDGLEALDRIAARLAA